MIDFETALGVLSRAGVEFIVVGGTAPSRRGGRGRGIRCAAGRPKDLEAVAELEALREERDR